LSEREQEWAAWMREALAGDAAAYRTVLQSLTVFLRTEVRRGFARYGRGSADVEDVVQETLLAIHLKRETWRADEPITPWVRAIARNKIIDSLRRGGKRINVPIDDVIDILPAAEPTEHLTERDAEQVLSLLNGRQREIVEAISISGASIRETAAKYDMKEGAVRVALHRGLATLSKAYRTQDNENG
jgi:RNA polymerase sigma-70 factor, ECF subfamily